MKTDRLEYVGIQYSPFNTIVDSIFPAILNNPELLEDFSKNYETALPFALFYGHHSKAEQTHLTNQIVEYYFNNEPPSAAKLENITNVREIRKQSIQR